MRRNRLVNTDILKSSLLLAVFTMTGTGLLLWVNAKTEDHIAANEYALLLHRLNQIVPPESYDNDPINDTLTVSDTGKLGSGEALTVYRTRLGDKPIATIISTVAPDGYNGAIRLLVGIDINGVLTGVRTVHHRETPGLGDKIESNRSNWIMKFRGKSLVQPPASGWAVKPDGGEFDSFTGATITPRAVVKAVHNTLLYYEQNKTRLLATQTTDR